MVAAKLATLPQGRPEKSGQLAGYSQDDAARLLNVAERSVRRAVVVRASECPALITLVELGRIAVSVGASLAGMAVALRDKVTPEGWPRR
jgi:hypothetical protein